MAQAPGPILPDIEKALKRRSGSTAELGRVAQRVAGMVSKAGLSALDAALGKGDRVAAIFGGELARNARDFPVVEGGRVGHRRGP